MPVYIDDKPRYDFQPSMLVCEHWAVIPSSFDSPPKIPDFQRPGGGAAPDSGPRSRAGPRVAFHID